MKDDGVLLVGEGALVTCHGRAFSTRKGGWQVGYGSRESTRNGKCSIADQRDPPKKDKPETKKKQNGTPCKHSL